MRVCEVIHDYSAKLADEYDDEALYRLQERLETRPKTQSLEDAALSIVDEEIKTKELVPSMEEGYKLLKTLLNLNKYNNKEDNKNATA